MAVTFKVVMGLGRKFLTRVGSDIFGLVLDLENFSKKSQIFQFFTLRVKKHPGQRRIGLLWVKSMVGSGRVRAHLYSKA